MKQERAFPFLVSSGKFGHGDCMFPALDTLSTSPDNNQRESRRHKEIFHHSHPPSFFFHAPLQGRKKTIET
jgi:hypothetical protein